MTMQRAAQTALDIQDACNSSGLVFEFARVMQALCDESARIGGGTEWKNRHPIVTMFLLKLGELNGCSSTLHEAYEPAKAACKELANVEALDYIAPSLVQS